MNNCITLHNRESSEISRTLFSLENTCNQLEALENIQLKIAEEYNSVNGIDGVTSDIARIVLESICGQLEVDYQDSIVSMEAFDSIHTKQVATRLSLESLRDVIVNAWEKIKEWFSTIWKHITEFFKKIFNSNQHLEKIADNLSDRISGLSVAQEDFSDSHTALNKQTNMILGGLNSPNLSHAANDKFWSNTLFDTLSIHGILSQSSINEIITNHELLLSFSSDFIEKLNAPLNKIESNIKDNNLDDSFIDSVGQDIMKLIKQGGVFYHNVNKDAFNNELPGSCTGPLINGKRLFHPNAELTDPQVTKLIDEVVFEPNSNFKEQPLPVLSKRTMQEMVLSARQLIKRNVELTNNDRSLVSINRKFDAIIIKINMLAKKTKEDNLIEFHKSLVKLRRMLTQVFQTASFLLTRVPAMAIWLSRALLQYVDRSLNEYPKAA